METGRRVATALHAIGRGEVVVRYRLIDTPEAAEATGFAGSPTIAVDGLDLFPSEGRTSDLACRIYFTPEGTAGLPTVQQLEAALEGRP